MSTNRSILRIEKAGKVHAAGPESHSPCEKQNDGLTMNDQLPGLLHWRNLCLTCRTGVLSRTGLATGKKPFLVSRFVANVGNLRTLGMHCISALS